MLAMVQDELPLLYRGHDVFLFTSRYEAWGMPVLEAMASGIAIVATRCLGLNGFAHHLVNCLLADPLVSPLIPLTTTNDRKRFYSKMLA
jgi:glycosyltransferase involved in cell wall biosynthesis